LISIIGQWGSIENVGLKRDNRYSDSSIQSELPGRSGKTSWNFRNETRDFSDLLSFAWFPMSFAYTASVNVLQKTAKEFKVQDIKASHSYKPLSGDVFRVTKILNRFETELQLIAVLDLIHSFMKVCVFLI
jgi:hypothetical protein